MSKDPKAVCKHRICPVCVTSTDVRTSMRHSAVEIRACSVTGFSLWAYCGECGAEWEAWDEPDWRPDAYDLLREKLGLVSRAEMSAWRRSRRLSASDADRFLGWEVGTFCQYEGGSRQTETHERQLLEELRRS